MTSLSLGVEMPDLAFPPWPIRLEKNRLAAQDHGWNKDRILGDLAGLVGGTCVTPQVDAPAYFRSIGLGLEDIAVTHGKWKLAPATSERKTQ